eukprot:7107935-Pyramimonas_sp.AAC.1
MCPNAARELLEIVEGDPVFGRRRMMVLVSGHLACLPTSQRTSERTESPPRCVSSGERLFTFLLQS